MTGAPSEGARPELGVVEWFLVGEHARAERVARSLRELGVQHLRTGLSWADWHVPGGRDWFGWLLRRLSADFELLPCILYTPPSIGVWAHTSSPPQRPYDYADFVQQALDEWGELFDHVELWNEPNNLSDWDWRVDPDWSVFAETIAEAASRARDVGQRVVLGGPSPLDAGWLEAVARHGLLEHVEAVGLHAFPETWEPTWTGWADAIRQARRVLARHGSDAELWVTETGFSTWRHDEHSQLRQLAEVAGLPVDRVYWYAAEDLARERATMDGVGADPRDYHFGLRTAAGTPKLLDRVWRDGGLPLVRDVAGLSPAPAARRHRRPATLVTGGAGFVGARLVERLLQDGERVVVLDSLARPGVERTLLRLREEHGGRLDVDVADVRDPFAVRRALAGATRVFHLAACDAAEPRGDFDTNLAGTLNVLEELRGLSEPPPLVYTSTTGVYAEVELVRSGARWQPTDEALRARGLDERAALDFRTPHGCSKGGADQYVLDYAKTYGVPATVVRAGCVYGPGDHGWVGRQVLAAVEGRPLPVPGDGAAVCDLLHVDDVVEALLLVLAAIERTAGMPLNLGGGPEGAVTAVELAGIVGGVTGEPRALEWVPEPPGQRRYDVSDTGRLHAITGWQPEVALREGLERLVRSAALHRRPLHTRTAR